jgi:hypothetical protein
MKIAMLALLTVACGGASKSVQAPVAPTDITPQKPDEPAAAALALLESPQFALVMLACPLPTPPGEKRSDVLSTACAASLEGELTAVKAKLDSAFADATKELYRDVSGSTYKGSPALQLPSASRTSSAEIEIPSVVDVVSRGFEQLLVDRLKLELQQIAQDLLREQLKEVKTFLPATYKLLGEVATGKQSLAETMRATLISDVLSLADRAANYASDVKAKIALTTIAAFLQGGDLTAVLQRLAATAPDKTWANAVRQATALARYIRQSDEIVDNGLLLAFADQKAAELAAVAFVTLKDKENEIVEIIGALRSARHSLHVMADASLSDETRARSIVAFAEQTLAAIDHLYGIDAESIGEDVATATNAVVTAGGEAAEGVMHQVGTTTHAVTSVIDRGAITRAISAVAARDLPTFVAQVSSLVDNEQVSKALRLLSMGAELSRAKNADAAAATIAAFTTGTTNIRRRVPSVRISALVGGNTGARWFSTGADNTRRNVWQSGLSALVGIEAAWPLSKTGDGWFGITVTGFDGLAALTYDSDSKLEGGDMTATKFNAKSFFAPGVLVQLGGKKISGGLSFTVLPNAVSVEMGNETKDLTVLRVLLTVGLSIPILELGSL